MGEQNQNIVINKHLLNSNINIKKSQFSKFIDKENTRKTIKPINLENTLRNAAKNGVINNVQQK